MTSRSMYLNMDRQWNDRSPHVNSALYNPEWVYGVCISHKIVHSY